MSPEEFRNTIFIEAIQDKESIEIWGIHELFSYQQMMDFAKEYSNHVLTKKLEEEMKEYEETINVINVDKNDKDMVNVLNILRAKHYALKTLKEKTIFKQ